MELQKKTAAVADVAAEGAADVVAAETEAAAKIAAAAGEAVQMGSGAGARAAAEKSADTATAVGVDTAAKDLAAAAEGTAVSGGVGNNSSAAQGGVQPSVLTDALRGEITACVKAELGDVLKNEIRSVLGDALKTELGALRHDAQTLGAGEAVYAYRAPVTPDYSQMSDAEYYRAKRSTSSGLSVR